MLDNSFFIIMKNKTGVKIQTKGVVYPFSAPMVPGQR